MNFKELAHNLVELDKREGGMAFDYVFDIEDLKEVTEREAEGILINSLTDILEYKKRFEFSRNNEMYFVNYISEAQNRACLMKQAYEIVKWHELKVNGFDKLYTRINWLKLEEKEFTIVFNEGVEEVLSLLSNSKIEWSRGEIERKYIELIIEELDILKIKYYQLDTKSFENLLFLDSKDAEILRENLLIQVKDKWKEEIFDLLRLCVSPFIH